MIFTVPFSPEANRVGLNSHSVKLSPAAVANAFAQKFRRVTIWASNDPNMKANACTPGSRNSSYSLSRGVRTVPQTEGANNENHGNSSTGGMVHDVHLTA